MLLIAINLVEDLSNYRAYINIRHRHVEIYTSPAVRYMRPCGSKRGLSGSKSIVELEVI